GTSLLDRMVYLGAARVPPGKVGKTWQRCSPLGNFAPVVLCFSRPDGGLLPGIFHYNLLRHRASGRLNRRIAADGRAADSGWHDEPAGGLHCADDCRAIPSRSLRPTAASGTVQRWTLVGVVACHLRRL